MGAPVEVMFHAMHSDPEPVETYRPDTDGELVDLILQCLAKSPRNRPASAAELLKRLRTIQARLQPGPSHRPQCNACGYVPNKNHEKGPVCRKELAKQKEKPEPLGHCPQCGSEIPVRYRYCVFCGEPTITAQACPACGEMNAPHYRFCLNCGTRLSASRSSA